MKIWQKDESEVNKIIEKFTVGRDKEFDIVLAGYDVEGSQAHASMLESIGMITAEESRSIQKALQNMLTDIREGRFQIEAGVEDVHSQVEFNLTKEIGEAGKKIHSGRSRNDQVAVDIKLFLRAEIQHIKNEV